jgi:hypothetical protein
MDREQQFYHLPQEVTSDALVLRRASGGVLFFSSQGHTKTHLIYEPNFERRGPVGGTHTSY